MNKKQRQTLKAVFSSPVRSDIKWTSIENLFKVGAEVSLEVREFECL